MSDLFGITPPPPTPGDLARALYIRVAVERSIARRTDESDDSVLTETLTYRVPEGWAPQVGQRVEVPLGRGNTPESGSIIEVGGPELAGDLPLHKIKPALTLDPARLPASLVDLARWMADYYVCPLGMVLATMMPAAVKHGTGRVKRTVLTPVDPQRASEILASIELKPAARRAWEAIVALGPLEPAEPRDLQLRIAAATLAPINRLVEAGLLERSTRQDIHARAALYAAAPSSAVREPTPTAAQARIVEGIRAALGSFSVHLLRGVTGSGKTEVYIRAIRHTLERGSQALVLVPEISLTPQTAARFIERFADTPDAVAVLHSGLSASERHRQWVNASSPRCKVVVGARSAVFAPLTRPGLIIVDEEHAGDYKQDQLPRYHGRDVAIKRAQLEQCPVLLGSATPSLESWSNAIPDASGRARFARWELPDRVGGGRLPAVELVDLTRDRSAYPRAGAMLPALSPRLRQALLQTLCDGGQAILLLNRRGFASHVCCTSNACDYRLTCEDCDAAMVLHRKLAGAALPRGLLRCHHCLAERTVPTQCPLCTNPLRTVGVGTQRLEDELAETLRDWPDLDLDPARAILRVDGDTMRSAKDYFEALDRFGRGELRVLLGTQMISKGLDFPNVRLVGVINADIGLSLPDFRSAERTFQLICQVAGRAGRGEHPGLVIVQTVNPADPTLVLAARHDYVGFARRELEIRRRSGLPPATRMARIVVRDQDHAKAAARAEELAALLESHAAPGSRILGPAPAPIARIAAHFRFSIEILAPRAGDVHAMLHALASRGLLKSDAHTAVDVDPIALA